jgi:hypothetical protein
MNIIKLKFRLIFLFSIVLILSHSCKKEEVLDKTQAFRGQWDVIEYGNKPYADSYAIYEFTSDSVLFITHLSNRTDTLKYWVDDLLHTSLYYTNGLMGSGLTEDYLFSFKGDTLKLSLTGEFNLDFTLKRIK